MGSLVRPAVIALALALCFSASSPASSVDESIPDSQGIAQLEQRAVQAKPKEQLFLYTELIHAMTNVAGKQMLDGDTESANATLRKVEKYVKLIHLGLASDNKRLKNAELLMRQTTRRLGEYLHLVSGEDQASLQAALKQLDQVQTEMLTQVFNR